LYFKSHTLHFTNSIVLYCIVLYCIVLYCIVISVEISKQIFGLNEWHLTRCRQWRRSFTAYCCTVYWRCN